MEEEATESSDGWRESEENSDDEYHNYKYKVQKNPESEGVPENSESPTASQNVFVPIGTETLGPEQKYHFLWLVQTISHRVTAFLIVSALTANAF